MALPGFLRRLFSNNGAGKLLNDDIIPTVNEAKTAIQLTTARTIQTNLASTAAASFNGTANITPGITGILPVTNGGTNAITSAAALTNLGAVAKIGDTMTGELKVAGTSAYKFRLIQGNYGVMLYNDGTNYYFLTTASGQAASGTLSALRPFRFNLASGLVTMENGINMSGTVTAPTQAITVANTTVATTAHVNSKIENAFVTHITYGTGEPPANLAEGYIYLQIES